MQKRDPKKKSSSSTKAEKYLGDFQIPSLKFDNLSQIFSEFAKLNFKKLNDRQKSERFNQILLDLIRFSIACGSGFYRSSQCA
jgi:hypothetical protein